MARGTDSDLAITTLQTDIGQLIGTLQYMSPEQCMADPHDIDTRSDVYALGVVFYELLTEQLPYDVRRVAMHEATRVIREDQPTKPSTINRRLRGDVETIALKALEKERERPLPIGHGLRPGHPAISQQRTHPRPAAEHDVPASRICSPPQNPARGRYSYVRDHFFLCCLCL